MHTPREISFCGTFSVARKPLLVPEDYFIDDLLLVEITMKSLVKLHKFCRYGYLKADTSRIISTIEQGAIRFGRQKYGNGTETNDLIIPSQESKCSRKHFKVNYSNGFKSNEIPRNFLMFLGATHSRLGANSVWKDISVPLLKLILSFIKPPRSFFISDVASKKGTLVKVPDEGYPIATSQKYILAKKTYIEILSVQYDSDSYLLDRSEAIVFQNSEEAVNEMLVEAHLRIRLVTNSSNQVFKLKASTSKNKFFFGKKPNADFHVEDGLVSRLHCIISYEESHWKIYDQSRNGTWITLNSESPVNQFAFTQEAMVKLDTIEINFKYQNLS